jgi:hypothetical protein
MTNHKGNIESHSKSEDHEPNVDRLNRDQSTQPTITAFTERALVQVHKASAATTRQTT